MDITGNHPPPPAGYAGGTFGKPVDALRGGRPAVSTTLTGAAPAAAHGTFPRPGAGTVLSQ